VLSARVACFAVAATPRRAIPAGPATVITIVITSASPRRFIRASLLKNAPETTLRFPRKGRDVAPEPKPAVDGSDKWHRNAVFD
jgi:hypothetical protein